MKSIEELVAQVKQSTYPDWNVDIDRFLLEFATRFLAAYTAQQEPVIWSYCPECGSEELHHEEGMHKQCGNCHQEWFSDIDYSDVVQHNLSNLYAAPVVPDDRIADLERQVAALKVELAEMEQLYGSEFNLNNNLIAVRAALTKENERLQTIDLDLQMAVQKLEASQEREGKLREALASEHADHVSLASSELGIDPWECEALALPTDDTALQARLKEEREKCAKVCDEFQRTSYLSVGTTLARMIRELS